MSSITYQKLDQRLANLENTFNILGYVPLVSTITGPARALYGTAELTAGIGLHYLKGAQYFITANPEHRNEAAAGYWYVFHGAQNINRGAIECLPIIGNLSTILYDQILCLRMNYTFERISLDTLPILESKQPDAIQA